MCIVVTYTIVRHAGHGFERGRPLGHEAVFKDHTSYGAVLAMLLPPAIAMVWRKHKTAFGPRAVGAWGGVAERGDRAVLHPGRLGEPGLPLAPCGP